jgi:hypothetical protein
MNNLIYSSKVCILCLGLVSVLFKKYVFICPLIEKYKLFKYCMLCSSKHRNVGVICKKIILENDVFFCNN